MIEAVFAVVGLVFVVVFAIWLYILLPADMARKRRRSELGWVLLSLCISPLLACLLLWLLGDNPNARS
jgi:uncharacterized BrkB/YihY/UPF0761 family membrane protein